MPALNIKVPYRKMKDGTFAADFGSQAFYAESKESLLETVTEAILSRMGTPNCEVVSNGTSMRVIQHYGDTTYTSYYDATDRGHLRSRGLGTACLQPGEDPIESELLQLAMLEWDADRPDEIPEYLPESKRSNFAAWVRFQLGYKLAIECGMSPTEAHHAACEVSHV